MARATLAIGGKSGNRIVFSGNRKYLPAHVRGIIGAYFDNWGNLKDISTYPQLITELGQVRADNIFAGTDWEALNTFYQAQLERFTTILAGGIKDGQPYFVAKFASPRPARPLKSLWEQYTDAHGVLRDNYDIWRFEKLLRRAGAKLQSDRGFTAALRQFGKLAVSFEESLSFFRQVQAYHSPDFLAPEVTALLTPALDDVHTLRQPELLPELAKQLSDAGAQLRIELNVEPVIAHHTRLVKAGQVLAPEELPAAADPRVASALTGKLKAELYPFQREGVAFLTVNGRALLADDMGLGKTLQAMSAALVLKARGEVERVLVICPASLKYQWQAEIHRFTGERCEVIGGSKDERESIYRAAQTPSTLIAASDRPLFYVINYELVHRDLEYILALKPGLLIIDEAQRIKNFRTKTNQAVVEIPSPYMFVLTGTPLENQLMELYTIMRAIDERALGRNPIAFRDRYVITNRFGGIQGYRLVEEVSRKVASLVLRRTKEQALDQLPDLVEQNVWLDLSDVQQQIYQELHGQARGLLSEAAWDNAATNNAMVLLQRLREVCDTPELIDPQHTASHKLDELRTIIDDQVQSLDRQVIIFTQWTRMGEIIKRELGAIGLALSFLHGGLKPAERQQLVERFQSGKDRVFISTDAGGTGLNLQAASLVVNYDLPFNPAKLSQRIARAHRLGQKSTVFAVNLLCRRTVEERLLGMLREKQALFDDVFGGISDPDHAALTLSGAGQQRSLREMLSQLIGTTHNETNYQYPR